MKTDIVVMGLGGHLMGGCMSKMKRQTIIFGKSWGEDEYAYHMKSFVDLFKIQDSVYYGKLHRWLFE
jgi:hypothetical protein